MQDENLDIAWTDRAGKDLDEIYAYLQAQVSEQTAEKITTEIYLRVSSLVSNPDRFPLETNVDKPGREIRYSLVGNYRIVFEFTGHEVFVLRILYTKRDLKKLLKRV